MINAELMILFNNLIAKFMSEHGYPFIYRIQDASYIKDLVKQMDIEVDETTEKIIDGIYLDSKYSSEPRFHNGLHIPVYSHTSNPGRKYPDLNNIYLIHAFHFKDLRYDFDPENHENWIAYYNQRNVEYGLMKSEYERALKLQRR